MTRNDLITKCGSEDLAEAAITLILDSIKMPFFEAIVKAKLKETEKTINDLFDQGYVYIINGSYHVNWSLESAPFEQAGCTYWDAPKEVIDESHHHTIMCQTANAAIITRNMLTSMIAVRR